MSFRISRAVRLASAVASAPTRTRPVPCIVATAPMIRRLWDWALSQKRTADVLQAESTSPQMQTPRLCASCVKLACSVPVCRAGSPSCGGLQSWERTLFQKVLPGFMSLTEEVLDVYKCDNAEVCPGGTPGSCTGASKGVGCFECADGTQWNGEDCQPCESWIRVGWGIAIVGVCVFLPFAHTVKMNDTSPTREIVVFTLLTIFEIGGNLLQTLAITGQMTLEWPQLLVDAFSFLEVFAFEATDLGISCISGSRPLQQFGFQVAVLPAGLLWVLVTHLLLRMLSRGRSLPQLMASLGQIVVVCFSAVTNLSMVPFMCFRHPNGRYSNLQMLSIICGSHDHAAMMIMGTCLGALLCAFWAMCVWILWRLPSWSLNESYHEHVVASEFPCYDYGNLIYIKLSVFGIYRVSIL